MPLPLRVLPATKPDPPIHCVQCGRCCTYVAVGVNPPRTLRFATDVLWYLYHPSVSVHMDADGHWSVVFESRCRNLDDDLHCAVYEKRPHICRGFDETGCEVNAPDHRDRVFEAPAQFLAYMREAHPRLHARLLKQYSHPLWAEGGGPPPPRGK